ncbi:RNA polymerase sigma factor [Lachnospiraceae bacterium NSJ-143]|nr:RNA polymerase sigma factor [Lachnospiraceae bacterium NSJ-143]
MQKDIYDITVSYILENQEKFYRLAFSYVKNKESALDVVQNSICKALEKCYSLKNPDALKTWFYRIIVNESLQHIKSAKSEISDDEAATNQIYSEPGFDKDSQVYNAVQQLSEPLKTVIVLHYYEDLTLKQIAEITDTNLNTIKTRLYSALKKLETELLKEAFV